MSGSIVQHKNDITAIIAKLVQADQLLNHIKNEQKYDPRHKPSADRRNASELQIILNELSNPSTNFSMFGGRVFYVKPKVVEANLNANGKAALFHFIWMMGKDNYEDAFGVFSDHITTIRAFFDHEMDVLAWQIGQLSLKNRMKWVKKLTKTYGTMDMKSYEAFMNHFGLYMTLTGPTQLLLPKKAFQSITPFIKKHDVPLIFSSGSKKSGYF
ncbi:MAG: hypothetical protein MK137_06655, partial [Rickettsiales bacterium]|nr:hypothetical protein [Rickettsiales bacterium]